MKFCQIILIFSLCWLTLAQSDPIFQEDFFQPQPQIAPQPLLESFNEQPLNTTSTSTSYSPPPQPFQFNLQTLQFFKNEIIAVACIFLYLIMYSRGRRINAAIMEVFYGKTEQYLKQQFSQIGFSKETGQSPFIGESGNEALFYASGRDHLHYMEIKFNMRKRQDMLYFYLYQLLFPEKDTLTIDIPVHSDLPLVLFLATKKIAKDSSETYLDLKKLTGSFEVENLNQNYKILGESAESVDGLIDNFTVRKLNEMNGLFLSIHYTDVQTFSSSSGHLRVILNAAYKKSEHFVSALELILHLVDRVATFKMTANNKQKALRAREAYHQSKEKEELEKHNEELRKKKDEKKKKEEAWIRSLPAQKQKKEDEKRKKKELSKMMKGKTMKVM